MMAGSEDTELRDLVMEALEKNGSLAKIRALLRANIFLAFESEREPANHNPALDRVLMTPEGSLALSLVAEFLEACDLANTTYVYRAESRQGLGYPYEGRKTLVDRLGSEYANENEPLLVSVLKQLLKNQKKPQHGIGGHVRENVANESHKSEIPRKDDDNCTYIVHDESASTRSDNSSDDKNKLLLRLPLDNSDTDTSSDSARDKTHSEYIPNANIRLDADSEDDNKNSNYMLKYFNNPVQQINAEFENKPKEKQRSVPNETHYTDDQNNTMNSRDSTSYHENNPKFVTSKLSNGNIDPDDRSANHSALQDIPKNMKISQNLCTSEPGKPNNFDILSKSIASHASKHEGIGSSKLPSEKSPECNVSSKAIDKSTLSEGNYSDEFSPTHGSNTSTRAPNKNLSSKSTDSDSIPEDISLNSSEKQLSSDSASRQVLENSQSSVSLSDVADLVENSAQGSPPTSSGTRSSHPYKSVIVMNSNVDEVTQRFTNLFKNRDDERRMSSTQNNSEEISDSPIHSLSNISAVEVHSD